MGRGRLVIGTGKTAVSADVRWMKKLRREGSCLIWTGKLNNRGRGTFYDGRVQYDAQTYAWIKRYGVAPSAPPHPTCGTRGCVNVAHLVLSPARRSRKQESLTADEVRVIRRRVAHGEPVAIVAKDYPASELTVRNAANRRTYLWVEDTDGYEHTG
jgi:hypothetical protein